MDKNDVEQVLQKMSEMQQTVLDSQKDPVLDKERIAEEFSDEIDALVEKKVQDRLDNAPVYRQPGAPIAMGGDVYDINPANKYAPKIRSFAKDGFYHQGSRKVKPVDYEMAYALMAKANLLNPQFPAPSDDLKEAIKAMTSTGSGTGDELVPTNMASSLWEDFFLASRVAATLEQIEMPTNPFDVPLGLGDTIWRKGSENTATSATDLTTAKSTLTATEQVTEVNWSYTLQEDAIVALMPAIRRRLAISGAEQIDAFFLNADSTDAATGNINLDDADPAADAYYLSSGQDGIRHLWIVDNTDQAVDAGGDALADADLVNALQAMDKYAATPDNVVCICDVQTYLGGFLNLTNTVTVDKFGANAVVKTGQLAAYRGIPLVISASHPLAESDGKVSATAGNNTLGSASFYNVNMWTAGFRRNLLIEVDRDIRRRQYIMVVSFRPAIAAHGTRSSAEHTAGIYNILV